VLAHSDLILLTNITSSFLQKNRPIQPQFVRVFMRSLPTYAGIHLVLFHNAVKTAARWFIVLILYILLSLYSSCSTVISKGKYNCQTEAIFLSTSNLNYFGKSECTNQCYCQVHNADFPVINKAV